MLHQVSGHDSVEQLVPVFDGLMSQIPEFQQICNEKGEYKDPVICDKFQLLPKILITF